MRFCAYVDLRFIQYQMCIRDRWCRFANHLGLRISASLTLPTFSSVITLRPGGFFIMFPADLQFSTHLRIVFRLGTVPCWPTLNWQQKSYCVSVVDSSLRTKLSYTNSWCCNLHCSIAIKVVSHWEENEPHHNLLPPPCIQYYTCLLYTSRCV